MFEHTTVTHVGLDVSKASISVALLRPDGRLDEERIANTPEDVRRLVRRWPEPKRVKACYEAGPHRRRPLPPAERPRRRDHRHRPIAHATTSG